MASYETRGSSIRAIVRVPGGGKLTGTFDTKAQAQAWAREQERTKHIPRGGRTCGALFEAYYPVAKEKDSGKANALRLLAWLDDPLARVPLASVITHDIDEWVARRLAKPNERTGKSITHATVNRELNLMSGAFTYGIKVRHWLTTNPCHGAGRPPKTPSRARALLTPDEIGAICAAGGYVEGEPPVLIGARVVTCFLIGLESGMRSGEILRLRPVDYFPKQHKARVAALERGGRKGARSGQTLAAGRNVALTDRAVQLLDSLLDTMPPNQAPVDGMTMPPYIAGLTDRQRDSNWRKTRDLAGVQDLHFHDCKHEAATRLARHMDVLALSHTLGTKNLSLLRDTYYNDDAERTAALLPSQLTGS